jgi:tryptophan synthase beta chain
LEVSTPTRTTTELDEKDAFTRLMERAGVKHRVRLASGARGRGLFPTGPAGWGKSDVLLSVPLDVCIVAPFGDESTPPPTSVARELGFEPGASRGTDSAMDTYATLRRAWERRNGVQIPNDIVRLADSANGDDRELAVALWVLFATRAGDERTNIWKAYAAWLPKPEDMPGLLLASDEELEQLQDPELTRDAKRAVDAVAETYETKLRRVRVGGREKESGDFAKTVSLDDLKWAFALVASRAVASPVGDPGSARFAAILTPFFDMANSDDISVVSASKFVLGTEDAVVSDVFRIGLERGLNQGVGGPRVVLETTRALPNADAEILIAYDPDASNRDLMLRYGFCLRGNRNERLPRASGNGAPRLRADLMRAALEAEGLVSESISGECRRRAFVAVASACGGFGNPDEDASEWELDADAFASEVSGARALARSWTELLRAFDTTSAHDEALLRAARAGKLPGATPRIVAAIEYRAERKRGLQTGVDALRAYVQWLEADDDEGGTTWSGFEDQE